MKRKCTICGNVVTVSVKSNSLKCPYCDTTWRSQTPPFGPLKLRKGFKKINGVVFHNIGGLYRYKHLAKERAEILRDDGSKVRIVRVPGGFQILVENKLLYPYQERKRQWHTR